MKASELIATGRKLAGEKTAYDNKTKEWMKWDSSRGWLVDCIRWIKAVGWGFSFNKAASHGGAAYLSNGVKDLTEPGMLNSCSGVSGDFSSIVPGEFLYMDGHGGIYAGNGEVIEATPAWGANGMAISRIDTSGRRTKNGVQVKTWLKHGRLPWVDYDLSDANKDPVESNKGSNEAAAVKLELSGCPLYVSSTAKAQAKAVTGTYYLWSDEAVNGRYRITNAASRIGVAGQVTGWIDAAYAAGTALKVGDKVKMASNGTIYGTTKKFATFVYKSTLYVRDIDGSRVVVSTKKTGDVTGAVDRKFLTKI